MIVKIPVQKTSQIQANVRTLGSYRESPKGSPKRQFHDDIIARGQNFVALIENKSILFAPSRFAGYQANTIENHQPGRRGGGAETNKAIDILLGDHSENRNMETKFIEYCNDFGIKPKLTTTRPRTYWRMRIVRSPEADEGTLEEDIKKIRADKTLSATQRKQLILARIGQGVFRKKLLARWNSQCAVTLCSQKEVLRASHIKRWCDASHEERLDPANGLMLAAHLDALFDVGLISFDDRGKILISKALKQTTMQTLGLTEKLVLQKRLLKEEKFFLRYHREGRFAG